jgi:hypothetical protein
MAEFRFASHGLGDPKPNYKHFELEFEADLDCAVYIVQDPGKSRRHDAIVEAVREATGMTEREICELGREVKNRIAQLADGAPPGLPISVPRFRKR